MNVEFCDTNILVYAYDASAGEKHEIAKQLVLRLWETKGGVLSTQVLQEFFVTVTRKLPAPLPHAEARQIVADLATWKVVETSKEDVVAAIDHMLTWKLSYWDAMVVTAAQKGRAVILWSEDMQHGQEFDQLKLINPFI